MGHYSNTFGYPTCHHFGHINHTTEIVSSWICKFSFKFMSHEADEDLIH